MDAQALRVPPGPPPTALPETVEEMESALRSSTVSPVNDGPTTLFLTVDTEDAYFTRPVLMTGEGIGRGYGVFGILDKLDAHAMKATFFVNVYEQDRQPPGVVADVVRQIVGRGHEVGLHSHPVPDDPFYGRPLFRLSREAQIDILKRGVESIHRWTGSVPVSFRAGGYALDNDTFLAMEEAGISVDSSCFFPSPNNCHDKFTVNAVRSRGAVIEAPITTVLQVADRTVKHSKLDFNWLSVDELMRALAVQEAPFATFMMHSFSFIEKATRRESEPSSDRALFTSEPAFGWYVDVFGPRLGGREAFSSFLDRVAAEPGLQVRTFAEALPELSAAARGEPRDMVPVVWGT